MLGTEKWRVKKEEETDPLASVNKKYQVGKKVHGITNGDIREKANAQAILVGGGKSSDGIDW